MNTSTILDSDNIERDIKGISILLDNTSRELFDDGYIPEADYLALQLLSKLLSENIAIKVKELSDVSYQLLRNQKSK